jgi:4-amino-4-deoxy-L-arabinose transferase-like glycosyltransferase
MSASNFDRTSAGADSLYRQKLIWWTKVTIFVLYGCFALFRLGWTDLGVDEAHYGIVAINILHDHRQLAVLSEDPLGGPGTKPFMYASSLAVSTQIFGKTEFALRLVNVIALAAAAWFLYLTVKAYFKDEWLAIATLFFFLLNPWTVTYARVAMPEPLVVLWGSIALYTAVRFARELKPGLALVCGLALAAAFLSKLWLCFPFVLACSVIFVATLIRRPGSKAAVGALLAGLVFILGSASHLMLVSLWTPAELRHWLQVYFVESFQSRVGGVGHDPAMWFRPWWFYLAACFKATFFAMPLVFLAAYSFIRERRLVPILILAALLSPVLIFSLFVVKQTSYVYAAFPAMAFLLAYGTVEFIRGPRNGLVVATVLSIVALVLCYEAGVLGRGELAAVTVLFLLYLAIALGGMDIPVAKMMLFAGALAVMLVTDLVAIRTTMAERTFYREIAGYLTPSLDAYTPQAKVFKAPEYAALEFYTYRNGSYWETYYTHQDFGSFVQELKEGRLAFYVVDPKGALYGGKITPAESDALRQYTTDVTPAVEHAIGRPILLKVLVTQPELDRLQGKETARSNASPTPLSR